MSEAPCNEECECGSGLVAKFWTGDGWMCGECYDEREADRDLERSISDASR